jgi:circadian clock protein KaiB
MCASEDIISSDPACETDRAWHFVVYVMGSGPVSVRVRESLEKLCNERSLTNYRIETVDISAEPKRGSEDQIIAVPTVVRNLPKPERRVVGDLSDSAAVVEGLGL